MYYTIYPVNDTTLYEKNPRRNSGIDQIIELVKYVPSVPDPDTGFYFEGIYNSRILMKFDTNQIKNLITSNSISKSSKFYLSLKGTQASDLPIEYNIDVHAVSQDWDNGLGHYNDYPQVTNGTSWSYKNGYYNGDGLPWITGSFSTGTTGSFVTVQGGGTWYTGSEYTVSQSFNYNKTPDIRVNVTPIIHGWLSGSIDNNGFIIKRSEADEKTSDYRGYIKFFSVDTHTIYIPKLEAVWDDSSYTSTGSLSEVSSDFVAMISNIRKKYNVNSKYRFRIKARDRFPTPSYSLVSDYLAFKRLPETSYYAIQDAVTDEFVIPFDDEGTKISIDSQGNYFNINFNAFLPERFYKIVLKVITDDGFSEHIIDEGFYFRVER